MIIIRLVYLNGRRHMIPAEPGYRTDGGTHEQVDLSLQPYDYFDYRVNACWPQTGVQNHFC